MIHCVIVRCVVDGRCFAMSRKSPALYNRSQEWNPRDATNVKFCDLLSNLVTTKSS